MGSHVMCQNIYFQSRSGFVGLKRGIAFVVSGVGQSTDRIQKDSSQVQEVEWLFLSTLYTSALHQKEIEKDVLMNRCKRQPIK